MSISRASTRNAGRGIVQFTAAFNKDYYLCLKNLRDTPQRHDFEEVYDAGNSSDDYNIAEGEILVCLTSAFQSMGGGGGMQFSSFSMTDAQVPLVISSLNSVSIRRSYFKDRKKPGEVHTHEEHRQVMGKMFRVVGVSLKNIEFQPTPMKAKDNPIVQTKGTVTMVNRGSEQISLGDLIYADFPRRDEHLLIVGTRNGLSKSKRTMVPRPFKRRGPVVMQHVREYLNGDNSPPKKDAVKVDPEQDDTNLAHCLDQFARLVALLITVTRALPPGTPPQASYEKEAQDLGLLPGGPLHRLPVQTGPTFEGMEWARFLQVGICMNKEVADHMGPRVYNSVRDIPENLVSALYLALEQDKCRIMGRAISTGKRGERFDADLGQPTL